MLHQASFPMLLNMDPDPTIGSLMFIPLPKGQTMSIVREPSSVITAPAEQNREMHHLVHVENQMSKNLSSTTAVEKEIVLPFADHSIQSPHCQIHCHAPSDSHAVDSLIVTIHPGTHRAATYINGTLLTQPTRLHSNDMIIFGTSHMFRYCHPKQQSPVGGRCPAVSGSYIMDHHRATTEYLHKTSYHTVQDESVRMALVARVRELEELLDKGCGGCLLVWTNPSSGRKQISWTLKKEVSFELNISRGGDVDCPKLGTGKALLRWCSDRECFIDAMSHKALKHGTELVVGKDHFLLIIPTVEEKESAALSSPDHSLPLEISSLKVSDVRQALFDLQFSIRQLLEVTAAVAPPEIDENESINVNSSTSFISRLYKDAILSEKLFSVTQLLEGLSDYTSSLRFIAQKLSLVKLHQRGERSASIQDRSRSPSLSLSRSPTRDSNTTADEEKQHLIETLRNALQQVQQQLDRKSAFEVEPQLSLDTMGQLPNNNSHKLGRAHRELSLLKGLLIDFSSRSFYSQVPRLGAVRYNTREHFKHYCSQFRHRQTISSRERLDALSLLVAYDQCRAENVLTGPDYDLLLEILPNMFQNLNRLQGPSDANLLIGQHHATEPLSAVAAVATERSCSPPRLTRVPAKQPTSGATSRIASARVHGLSTQLQRQGPITPMGTGRLRSSGLNLASISITRKN